MAFLRFILSNRHPDSGVETGLFASARVLRDTADVSDKHRQSLQDILAWFSTHLAVPTRFNRTSSQGHYRRNSQGIAWFRDTANDHLARMHQLKVIFEEHGYNVTMIREERIGYIVYEDEFQVVAEPFAETQTGPA